MGPAKKSPNKGKIVTQIWPKIHFIQNATKENVATNQKDKCGLVGMELVSIVALEKDWLVWNWLA